MGTIFFRDKKSDADGGDELISTAKEAVDKVLAGHDDIQKKMTELQTVVKAQSGQMETLVEIRDRLLKETADMTATLSTSCAARNTPKCQHQVENEVLKKKLLDMKSEVEKSRTELEKQQKTYESKSQAYRKLQEDFSIKDNEFKSNQHRIEELSQKLDESNKAYILETKRLKGEIDRTRQENNIHELKIRQLTEDKHSLERQVGEYRNEIQQLEGKLRHATQRKVVVSLYCGAHQILQEAYSEMVDMLTNHMETQGIQIQVDRCSDPQSHPVTSPLLVLCINASRLGTDVQQAISNVNCDKSVSVVVLHHKECHALPSQASDKILIGSQYRQLGAIVDVAFLKSKGMYPCDMNEKALNRLTDFLSQFIKQGES